jgi:hypothetical protein
MLVVTIFANDKLYGFDDIGEANTRVDMKGEVIFSIRDASSRCFVIEGDVPAASL